MQTNILLDYQFSMKGYKKLDQMEDAEGTVWGKGAEVPCPFQGQLSQISMHLAATQKLSFGEFLWRLLLHDGLPCVRR